MTEQLKEGLWLTSMGRVVLDNHNWEVFAEPYDKKLMTKGELKHGIPITEFKKRLEIAAKTGLKNELY